MRRCVGRVAAFPEAEGIAALLSGGLAAALGALDEHPRAKPAIQSAGRATLERALNLFARRMVVRFAETAKVNAGVELTDDQRESWFRLVDIACDLATTDDALAEHVMLDRQYERGRASNDEGEIRISRLLEASVVLAEALALLRLGDSPQVPPGSLPAGTHQEFVQRGGSVATMPEETLAVVVGLAEGSVAMAKVIRTTRERT